MNECIREPTLIVASEYEQPAAARIWHCWWPPEQREALDWLTLTKLFGWESVTWQTNSDIDMGLFSWRRLITIACDPDSLGDELMYTSIERGGRGFHFTG